MEEKESNNNNNNKTKNDNSPESKPKPLPNPKKQLQASLFAFSESMPNLLAHSPRTSGVTDSTMKAITSPRITEDHSGNPIRLEAYSTDLVFKKTPYGERNIALENIIIEDDLSPRNYWQELSTSEAPEADDQEDGSKNFFRKLRTKSITLTKRALKALDLDEKGMRKSDDFVIAKRQTLSGSASIPNSSPENRDRSKSKSMDTKSALSPFKKSKSMDRRISEAPVVVKPIKKTVATTPTKERSPSRQESPKVQRPGAPPPLRWTDVGDPRVKKFEEPDDATNVQITDVNEKQIMSACTLEKLMQKLTLESYPSADLINSFLLTYRQFLSPRELFQLVELRWNSYPPPGMDIDEFKAKKLLVIRFKVFNLLKGWIEKGFNEDFKDDGDMLEMLHNFIEKMSADGLPKEAERLQDILQKKVDGEHSEPITNQHCPKRIIVPLLSLVHVSILNFHPEEFARQVTLIEQKYFNRILPKELLGLSWTKKDKEKLSPNVMAMTHFSNHFVSMMANEVLRAEDLRTRILVFNRIVTIGTYFLKLGNFNGVFETHSALLSRSVYRMKNTWNCLPEESWANFQKLKFITNSDNNYKNYREALNQAEPPRLPYIGRYLSDFLFTDEKYPDRLPNTELINFGKMQSLAGILQNIKFNQGHRYWFEEVEKIQDYIKNYEPLDNKQMYALSLKREPREAASNAASAPTSPRGIRSAQQKESIPPSDHSADSSMSNSLNSNESYGSSQNSKKTSL